MNEQKTKIIKAWNHADELREDFALSDTEITEMIPAMRERIKQICELLQDEFTTEEYNEIFPREN